MTVEAIKEAITALPEPDRHALACWLNELVNDLWDRQLESDVAAGRLDALAEEALRDSREGRCTEF